MTCNNLQEPLQDKSRVKNRLRALRRAAATLALSIAICGTGIAAEFTFAALGDMPYNADEESRFIGMIAEMNREKLAFVVHVGDFKAAIERCSDELFQQRKEWFDLIHHAFVYVPGDNEWIDCMRTWGSGHKPLERLQKLRELFFSSASSLGQAPIKLIRQADATRSAHDYPEHARWEYRRVLFLTLNAPGPDNNARAMPDEFSRRSMAIREWIEDGFRIARSRSLRAVVILMHANPWTLPGVPRRGFRELLATLAGETRRFAGQVLLLHGDTHHYRFDQPPLNNATGALPNFTRLEVFGSPFVNWVRIRVTEEGGRVRFDATPGS